MSGQGRELGEYGLHAYTEVKTVSGNKLFNWVVWAIGVLSLS